MANQAANRPAQILAVALLLGLAPHARAQTSGNIVYQQGGGKASAQQRDRNQRAAQETPSDGSMFLDADLLMNVKADEYVAVFGLSQECATVDECSQKMAATIATFTTALKTLHIPEADIYTDFITQSKVYGYDIADNLAKETLQGFDLKKNISIHYANRDLLDKILLAAAKAQIYDLIKVDYVVKDINAVQDRLMTEASAVIHQKIARDEKLLGIKLEPPVQIYIEHPAIYYPAELYDTYTAADAESLTRPPNLSKLTVQHARKERTVFFNPLDPNGFDKVINPVILEPVVQFTLYLKVKYTIVR